MRAVVLVGGFGTRLRPLTLGTPKQMLPVVGITMLERVIARLHSFGVDDAVLSLGYRPDAFAAAFPDGICAGVKMHYAVEPEPLDTAGAIRFAAEHAGIDERFLAVNGDVLSDLDITGLWARHASTGAQATIALTPVDDPSRYGVVPLHEDGQVEAFIEKPDAGTAPSNWINAGTYVLEPSVLELIKPEVKVSIEREVFPALVGDGLYGFEAAGYWIDIGTPERYLESTWDLLAGRVASTLPERDETGSLVYDGCLLSGAHVGPMSVIGPHCSVGTDARVERSVLHERVQVGADAHVDESVLAERVRVGERARVGKGAMVGAGARIGEDAVIAEGARIDPGTEVVAGARVEAGA